MKFTKTVQRAIQKWIYFAHTHRRDNHLKDGWNGFKNIKLLDQWISKNVHLLPISYCQTSILEECLKNRVYAAEVHAWFNKCFYCDSANHEDIWSEIEKQTLCFLQAAKVYQTFFILSFCFIFKWLKF